MIKTCYLIRMDNDSSGVDYMICIQSLSELDKAIQAYREYAGDDYTGVGLNLHIQYLDFIGKESK